MMWSRKIAIKEGGLTLPKSRRVIIKGAKQSTWKRHPESALPKGEVEDDKLMKKKGYVGFKGFKHCLRYHPELVLDVPMPMSGCLL